MIITIYDYADKTKEITLPDKEIAEIFITILSGDETGFVLYQFLVELIEKEIKKERVAK